jgi:hypothetical protein
MTDLLNTPITFLPNVRNPSKFKAIPLKTALLQIKKGAYKALVKDATIEYLIGDEARYKEKKSALPSYCFHGTFRPDGKVVNTDFQQSSSLFHFDIDKLTQKKMEEVREVLVNLPYTVFMFTSPSGNGLKGCLQIDPDFIVDDATFKVAYTQIERFLAANGIICDPACKDIRRICFTSYDPDLYFNKDAEVFPLVERCGTSVAHRSLLAPGAPVERRMDSDEYIPIDESDSPNGVLPDINASNAAKYLPPAADQGYAEWRDVGAALHYQFQGSHEGLVLFDEWSQNVREYKGFDDVEKQWRAYKRTSGPVLTFKTLIRVHNELRKENQQNESNTPFSLSVYSLNGNSEAMELKMLDDTYVLNQIAILGQATVIYAKPNTGKTLLVLWLLIQAIKSGAIKGEDVFYINADDNYKGLVQKLKLAETYGFQMLAPGHEGFESSALLEYTRRMVSENAASGKVIILDTLKKFTNLMDKNTASDFMRGGREFIANGGTLILLAHTNKNRNGEGKVIFGGTSDIVDDVDCAYTLDEVEAHGSKKHVLFENIKSRGDVAREIAYSYTIKNGQTYSELLDSVEALDEAAAEQARKMKAVNGRLDKNKVAIDAITEAFKQGLTLKTELIEAAHKDSGLSKPRLKKALDDHTGDSFANGGRWKFAKGDKNSKFYSLLKNTESSSLFEKLDF